MIVLTCINRIRTYESSFGMEAGSGVVTIVSASDNHSDHYDAGVAIPVRGTDLNAAATRSSERGNQDYNQGLMNGEVQNAAESIL
ncbi:MAG: hypothetical protein BZY83_00535 [SAR202 cluster bacterium Casp-Chloro-G2]|nr:MAG: hypothetical protein BZY83_00535 [SAR202 cluster bacterium Casp-Chloro-G2]